jgi:hypothetical protein
MAPAAEIIPRIATGVACNDKIAFVCAGRHRRCGEHFKKSIDRPKLFFFLPEAQKVANGEQ